MCNQLERLASQDGIPVVVLQKWSQVTNEQLFGEDSILFPMLDCTDLVQTEQPSIYKCMPKVQEPKKLKWFIPGIYVSIPVFCCCVTHFCKTSTFLLYLTILWVRNLGASSFVMCFNWHHLVTFSWCLGWSGGFKAPLLTHLIPWQAQLGLSPSSHSLRALPYSLSIRVFGYLMCSK